jgi:hypothetical protein
MTPILDKLLEYKRNWIQHVNRMPRNRLPRVMKRYYPTGRRNYGRPLKRLLNKWDRNGATSSPTPRQIYDDVNNPKPDKSITRPSTLLTRQPFSKHPPTYGKGLRIFFSFPFQFSSTPWLRFIPVC